MRTLSSFAAILALCGAALAQNSTLTATFDTTTNVLTRSLSGAPVDSGTVIFMARQQGTTSMFNGAFTLDLDGMLRPERVGRTDAMGALTEIDTLNPARLPVGVTIYFQAVTVDAASLPTPPTTTPTRPGRPGPRPGPGPGPRPGPRPNPSQLVFVVSNVASVTF